jgi:bleomycin hydrolase
MACNIIRKHGLVPKSAYPESHSSSATGVMNANLKSILRATALELRSILADGKGMDVALEHKEKRLSDIWNILCLHLGTPPTDFDWQWKDKDEKLQRRGRITPQQFAKEYVTIDWEDYGEFWVMWKGTTYTQ